MPTPVSRTRTTTTSRSRAAATGHRAARRRVARRVREEVGEHLRESHLVAVDASPCAATDRSRRCLRSSNSGAVASTARATTVASSSRRFDERHLAARHARHVEQVVHEPHEVLRLADDHVELLASVGVARAAPSDRAAVRIGVSGFRSSCDSSARNSSLRRSASRSASSTCLRRVTSTNAADRSARRAGRIAQRNRVAVEMPDPPVVEAHLLLVIPHFFAPRGAPQRKLVDRHLRAILDEREEPGRRPSRSPSSTCFGPQECRASRTRRGCRRISRHSGSCEIHTAAGTASISAASSSARARACASLAATPLRARARSVTSVGRATRQARRRSRCVRSTTPFRRCGRP